MLFLYILSYSRHAFVWQSGKCLYRVHTSNISIFKIWHSLSGVALTTSRGIGKVQALSLPNVKSMQERELLIQAWAVGDLPSLQAPFLDLLN